MRTVVITGGTRGLGYELAKEFLQRKYNVVICGTSDASVNKAVELLGSSCSDGEIAGMKCNVSVLSEVEALADFAEGQFEKIDIWINNAGVNQSYCYFWEVCESETEFLLNVDLKGAINGTSVATKRMIKQGGGAIYNVEGMGSNDAIQSFFALYGTAKRAVTYFTDAAAHEVAENGYPIIVGKLSPGIMITDFLTSAKGEKGTTTLNDKTKKVYNILGDYPDVIAKYLVAHLESNKKNGRRIAWLTGAKAAFRFMTAGFNKRNFFE